MTDDYRSDIPLEASEDVIERYPSGARRTSRYLAGGRIVGARSFFESGGIELETPRHDGRRHGTEYQWDDTGRLRSAIPYRNGLEHGKSRQWGPDGKLIGTYEMRDGTGVDRWQGIASDGSTYLSELRRFRHGERHGIEWLINEDGRSVHREMTYWDGVEHGILREWDADGRLSPGRPAFFVLGTEVTPAEYRNRAADDPSLPRYRKIDDRPQRASPGTGSDPGR